MVEWDEDKRQSNIRKHRVDFFDSNEWEWDAALVFADERKDYGERRFIAYVPIGRRLHVVIFTERNDTRRLISARKANMREIRYYEKKMDHSN